jgi:hypothetical protein
MEEATPLPPPRGEGEGIPPGVSLPGLQPDGWALRPSGLGSWARAGSLALEHAEAGEAVRFKRCVPQDNRRIGRGGAYIPALSDYSQPSECYVITKHSLGN